MFAVDRLVVREKVKGRVRKQLQGGLIGLILSDVVFVNVRVGLEACVSDICIIESWDVSAIPSRLDTRGRRHHL